jgi:GT2 family glycosyltransferase
VEYLFKQQSFIKEILVIDQTQKHNENVEKQLSAWHEEGLIHWIRLKKPSTAKALNTAILEAKSEIILFLDDDIIPSEELVIKHLEAYRQDDAIWAVAGQVIQPEGPKREKRNYGVGLNFPFDSKERKFIESAMAGNLSVKRKRAIEVGGFDENFIGAAFNFELEFAERLIDKGGKILFEPQASIKHLREKEGGVRSFGNFSRTLLPLHAVGAYYYFFRSKRVRSVFLSSLRRLANLIHAKHYLYKPWWIPVTLIAELLGFLLAIILVLKGPRFIGKKGIVPC